MSSSSCGGIGRWVSVGGGDGATRAETMTRDASTRRRASDARLTDGERVHPFVFTDIEMMTIAARTTTVTTRVAAKAPTASRAKTVMRRVSATRRGRFVAADAAADDLVDGLQDKLSEVTTTLGEAWEESDEKPAIVTLGVYGFVGLVALNGTLRAVDSLPLIPSVLELVGILFSAFFVYQNLLYKPDRAALRETITKTLNKIL